MKKINTAIKILIAEHDAHDLAMIDNELKKGEIDFVSEIVQNEVGYRKALKNFIPDIILCDYRFPSFDGTTAFKIREQLAPETPFIIVSGTIGEENSIELIKNGVTDFVLKDKMFALNMKVTRALNEAKERKEKSITEIELKQTATHLAEAQKLAKLGSWDYDFADNKLTWSEQLYNVFDTDKQTFNETHGSFLHLIDEAYREYVEKTSKHTQETGDAFIIEYGITTHKGEKRVIQEHGYGVKDATGKVIRLFGTAQDITERKKAENAVKESEAKYRAFFENSMDGILLTVTDGNILAANPAACKIFNMTEQEICDAGRFGLVDLSDPRVEDLIKQRQLTGEAQGELTFLRKDRTTFAGEISSVLFTDSFGQERTSMIIRDISARKEAEEKLIDNYAMSRMAGEIAKLGGWNVKLEENRVYWSDEVAAIHEMPVDYSPLVKEAINFYAPEWRDKIREVFTNCAQKGIPYDELMEIFTASGKRIWVRTIGEAVRDSQGKIVKVQGAFKDVTERKKIEKALVEYKYALDESSIVAITDQKGIIKHVNENFCKISKYSAEELIGQDHRIISSGYHPKSFIRNLWVTIANGKIWRGEMCNKAKDGSIYWVDTTIVPLLNEQGKPLQYIAIRADITKRKKAEGGMKLLSKRLQLATNSAGMGIWDWDIVNNHLVWDEGMYQLYKIDEKQLGSVYDGWTARLHPQDMERVNREMQNAIAGRKEYDTEFRIVLDDFSVRYIKASAVVERDAEGNTLNMVGANWDITELKEKENKLRKSEVFNRSVVNSLSSHLSVVDDTGQIVSINEAWKRFALENGETSMQRTGVGSNYFEVCEKAFMDGDQIAGEVLQAMKNVFNKKTEDFYLEYPCHSPSEERWFGLRVAKFESDEPLILLVHTNLTERILAERERQKITDDLIHRNQDLEQFTYIVSHNLRAPVANIKGLSDILTDESLSKDEAGSYVKDLLSSVNKLDTVIIDLNYILQMKTGVNEARERVVIAELVNGIEESIHSLVFSENVKIVAQFDEVAEMITLKSYLYSIFYNLILNSIKYKRPDVPPVIKIKSSRREDEIELIFKDNGRGIDLEKNGSQVFGLYKRFHREIEGKGLGLFIVKTHVEALGGRISIKSEVNKGTEFKIIFPNE